MSSYVAPAVMEHVDINQFGAIPNSSTMQSLISMMHNFAKATDGTGAALFLITRKRLIWLIIGLLSERSYPCACPWSVSLGVRLFNEQAATRETLLQLTF